MQVLGGAWEIAFRALRHAGILGSMLRRSARSEKLIILTVALVRSHSGDDAGV